MGEIYQAQGDFNKCCNYWLLAANIHPWDTEFWGQVAELSSELGYIDQAIYCYGRAITSDVRKSCDFILQRALLYQERKQFGKALEGFQKLDNYIHKIPTSLNIWLPCIWNKSV